MSPTPKFEQSDEASRLTGVNVKDLLEHHRKETGGMKRYE